MDLRANSWFPNAIPRWARLAPLGTVVNEKTLDPHRAMASLASQRVALDLGTLDLCFAAVLHLKATQAGLTAFSEEQLNDAFELVCDTVEPGTENVTARANHAIRRLREQRVLLRVDGAGVLRPGEFALSRLGVGIVEFFVREEVLTSDSLTLLARTLMASVAEVLQSARRATSEAEWKEHVVGPLKVTVCDLVDGIERRQRGLDLQQEEFQRRIASVLEADWFGAIEECQGLLESTAATLRELNEILLRDMHQLGTLLQNVMDVARESQDTAVEAAADTVAEAAARLETPFVVVEAEAATRALIEQTDRIASWGASRQRAWSEYYEYVHRYLRDVVRLDPSRALTERLRGQLSGHARNPFGLVVANAPAITLLRITLPKRLPPPVKRPRKVRDTPPEERPAKTDPRDELEQRVRNLLNEGITDLGELTLRLTENLPKQEQFLWAGRVAQALARILRPQGALERPWVPVGAELEIEQWLLPKAGSL